MAAIQPTFSANQMSENTRSIAVLAFPGAQLLDITGPLQVFASANDLAALHGRAAVYSPRVVATDAGPVTTSAGLTLIAESLHSFGQHPDTLIVAGGESMRGALEDPQLIRWVRQQAGHSRRIASVCTGAFVLAEAGLLDGHRAVTHWMRCDELASRYPAISVEADPIFIHDGSLWTSAGVTAGIDLALALVEDDLGRAVALDVARRLVVFLKRPGGQAQFSATLSMQGTTDRIGELLAWIAEHLAGDLSVPVLAKRAGMSDRSFARHFHSETGHTPARAVEQIRIETAQRLLCETQQSIKEIAARCGFGSEDTMRRSFVRARGVTPLDYRERFTR